MYKLSLAAGRSCQSPRTGFIHLFAGDPGGDAIPLYENFCYALALFRQKTAEGVLEGKEMLERLFAFQTADGNFPTYLHEFPRAWDPILPLRIAPILESVRRNFSTVLNDEFKGKLSLVLEKLIACAAKREPFDPIWQHRLHALRKEKGNAPPIASSSDASEALITDQLSGADVSWAMRLVHPKLKAYIGPCATEVQERFEPRPSLIEYALADSPRLEALHPQQLKLSGVEPIESVFLPCDAIDGWQIRSGEDFAWTYLPACSEGIALRLLWEGTSLHSLVIPAGKARVTIDEERRVRFDLPEQFEMGRSDLVEVALYCNLSPETEIFIDGRKATLFQLGQRVEIRTKTKIIQLQFDASDGQFVGQISRANRPFQCACKSYEAFDWKIALRTLRRSPQCHIQIDLNLKHL